MTVEEVVRMANPKTHFRATLILMTALFVIGLLDWIDIFWLFLFGVIIDLDHIYYGRLYSAFKRGGISGLLASWKKFGWFDENHLNIFHTWPALAAVFIFSFILSDFMPLIGFVGHWAIDSFSADTLKYPKCSPATRDICRLVVKLGGKRFLYKTEGVP